MSRRLLASVLVLASLLAGLPVALGCGEACERMPCCKGDDSTAATLRESKPCCRQARVIEVARPKAELTRLPLPALVDSGSIVPAAASSSAAPLASVRVPSTSAPLWRMHCALLL